MKKPNREEKLKSKKAEMEQSRIRIKELENQKQWLDWVATYGDALQLKLYVYKETNKDYLETLIEQIGIRLVKKITTIL